MSGPRYIAVDGTTAEQFDVGGDGLAGLHRDGDQLHLKDSMGDYPLERLADGPDFSMVAESIPADEELVITQGRQLIVYNKLSLGGRLTIAGKAVII